MEISKEYLHRLDGLILNINKKVNSNSGGNRKSSTRGSSMEFSDFKNYTYGDSIKNIDWNSYARFDKPYIKLFMEERQANINIIIDTSRSMEFGDKANYSKMLAVSIAYIALNNMDNVSIFLSDENLLLNISSKNQFNKIVDFVDGIDYNSSFDFDNIAKISGIKNGMTFLISDFLFENDTDKLLKALQYLKQKTVLVQLLDKTEVEPDISGMVKLVDSETDMGRSFDIDEDILEKYKASLKELKCGLNECCKKRDANFIDLSTDMDLLYSMTKLL